MKAITRASWTLAMSHDDSAPVPTSVALLNVRFIAAPISDARLEVVSSGKQSRWRLVSVAMTRLMPLPTRRHTSVKQPAQVRNFIH